MSKLTKTGHSSIFESMLSKLGQAVQAPPTPPQTEPQTFTGEVPQQGTGWGRIELKNLFEEWLTIDRSGTHERAKLELLEKKIVSEIQNMKEPFTPTNTPKVNYEPSSFPSMTE